MSARHFLAAAFLLSAVFATTTVASASRMIGVTVTSKVLSTFWKEPVTIRADVLLPDSYDGNPRKEYPVIYWFTGFEMDYNAEARDSWSDWSRAMRKQQHEAILVFPDAMFRGVYTEFADSANTGPWGAAFTEELVPSINTRYRVEKSFVAGISSGGWAALWLETTYAELFNGAWAFAPDPISFRDFSGPDLTKSPPQNFYTNGKREYRFIRLGGTDRQTLREFVQGGTRGFSFGPAQFDSFNAVFSPRGEDAPQQLFDLKTGAINASVAEYWEANYDITNRVIHDSPEHVGKLVGKVHLIVGSWDTYHLEGPSKLFCYALYNLNLHPDCTLVDEADHADVLDYDGNYENHILRELYSGTTIPATSAGHS